MIKLSFEVDGEKQLDRAMSRFGEGIHDMRPAFKLMAESFKKIEQKQFDSEGSHGGSRWAPLSSTYAAWKGANFGGLPILQLTGLLRESLTGGSPWYVERITKDSLVLGTSVEYAIFHQRGTMAMPPRPVINLSEQDKMEWIKILHNFAFDQQKKARLA